MKKQLLHTPEGVRDIYNEECENKLVLQDNLNKTLRRYGYRPIQTPTFEFFDIFGREIGTTPSKNLYKFFDREGNTLVLRPDITPSVARSTAKYFGEEDMPIRLCYMGNTFINNISYQGRLKENTQIGAELIGDGTVDADAEMIAMVIASLKAAGLKEFQVSIGHASFFRGLTQAAGLTEEQTEELRSLISNKNFFGVEGFAQELKLSSNLKQLFGMLDNVYRGSDELSRAKLCAAEYPQILDAIGRLEELQKILEVYKIERYVTFELGVISDYQYYTGIIFSGYTFGSGEAIVKGGRYDNLLAYFGKDSTSIGFALIIDQLMAALSRQKIDIPCKYETSLIVYQEKSRSQAIPMAQKMRMAGKNVELAIKASGKTKEDYLAYAGRNHISEVKFL